MIEHGKVKSTISPEPLVIDEHSVWVHSNITPIEEAVGEGTFTGFEFDMVQYDKDEYIELMAKKNQTMESHLTDTQVALVEVYELITPSIS